MVARELAGDRPADVGVVMRAEHGDDAGFSIIEVVATTFIMGLAMAMVMGWIVSTTAASDRVLEQGTSDSDIGLLVDRLGRDVRSATRVSSAEAAPLMTYLDGDTVIVHTDTDRDGVPTRIVWDRPTVGGPAERQTFDAVVGTGPDWIFSSTPSSTEAYLVGITSPNVFRAVDAAGADVTSCDASAQPQGCIVDQLVLDIEYRAADPDLRFDAMTEFTFRNEVGRR